MRYIGVIGAGSCDVQLAELAWQTGRQIAARGAVLLCGGLGGVMEAAARGAREAGGTVIGILPGGDRTGANPFLSYSIVTGLGEARNLLIVRSSQALIAISGGYGTLSEIAFALKTGVPVVGLATWELSLAGQPETGIYRVQTPVQAAALALELAGEKVD